MRQFVYVCGFAVVASSANAGLLQTGTYGLSNHPDGSANPPLYGFRLDEMFNVTGGKDVFTFDFDHADSAMFLDFDGSSIRIYGQSYGGRDTGSSYANDQYLGVYVIDFTYTVGVQFAAGDDDLIVAADMQNDRQNTGTIEGPSGGVVSLWDKSTGSYTFRFGDEDNDNGHRGFAGISGWGWVNHTNRDQHIAASDWLFTANFIIPSPASAALLGIGGLVAAGRNRARG